MAFQKSKTFAKSKRLSADESQALWGRRKKRQGMDWLHVDTVTLKAALVSACMAGVSLGFARAQGGLGVCITVWDNGEKMQEFAQDAEEMNDLLNEFIDRYEGDAEDTRAAMGGPGLNDQVAAD